DDREGDHGVGPRPAAVERREADPTTDPAADRGAAQGARQADEAVRRGGPRRGPQRPPRRDAASRGARAVGAGRRRRGAGCGGRGPEHPGPPRPQDRRPAKAQGSRHHGGLSPPGSNLSHALNLISRIRSLRRIKPLPARESPDVAESVAIIMDGNGRWAKKRGLPTAAGHRAGARTVRRIVEASIGLGIHDLSIFAFSTENWSRPREEVDALMDIFAETIERELPDLIEQGVRVRFIGRKDRAPEELRRRMDAMEDRTELNTRMNLWV